MTQDLAGAVADRYRIERELGAGGMATVYLADAVKQLVAMRDEIARRRDALRAGR